MFGCDWVEVCEILVEVCVLVEVVVWCVSVDGVSCDYVVLLCYCVYVVVILCVSVMYDSGVEFFVLLLIVMIIGCLVSV